MKRRVHMGLFNGRKKFKGGAFYGFRDLGDGADELLLFLSHVERTAAASGIEISGEPKRLDAGGFWFVYYPLADGGEGTAEAVIIDCLVKEGKTLVPPSHIVENRDGKPYTTLRKINRLQDEFFGVDYPHGLMIVRVKDQSPENFRVPKLYRDSIIYRDVITRPEIESLVLAREDQYRNWYEHGKTESKPSEWCERELGFGKKLKTYQFLKQYWNSADVVIDAIRNYDSLIGGHKHDQLNLSDLLED